MLFKLVSDSRFYKKHPAISVGKHGLHCGIRPIDNLLLLHNMQSIIKREKSPDIIFCKVSNSIRACIISSLRISMDIEQSPCIAITVNPMEGVILAVRHFDSDIKSILIFNHFVVPYRQVNIKIKS